MNAIFFYFAIATSSLGSDDFQIREQAEQILSNPLGALYLASNMGPTEDLEVLVRVRRIKRNYAPYLFADLRELVVYRQSREKWFWQFAFEGTSVLYNDKEIRGMFDREDWTFKIQEHLIDKGIIPSWCKVKKTHLWVNYLSNCYIPYLTGPEGDGHTAQMRDHFTFFNQKGQAYRSVIGGMYGMTR